jgi:polyferredoxin
MKESVMTRSARQRHSRFEDLSDDEIRARWRDLRPMFFKWLILCVLAAPALFVLNHFLRPGPPIDRIVTVAFQIAIGGNGVFAFLLFMALIFSRRRSDK